MERFLKMGILLVDNWFASIPLVLLTFYYFSFCIDLGNNSWINYYNNPCSVVLYEGTRATKTSLFLVLFLHWFHNIYTKRTRKRCSWFCLHFCLSTHVSMTRPGSPGTGMGFLRVKREKGMLEHGCFIVQYYISYVFSLQDAS